MNKILAYGEIMLRISSDDETIDNNYTIGYGGCEANALSFLGQRKHNCDFLSSFPDNFVGRDIELFLKSFNIDCNLNFDENRLGVITPYQEKIIIPLKFPMIVPIAVFPCTLFQELFFQTLLKKQNIF